METFTEICKKFVLPRARGKCLDVGCGDGYLISAIADKLKNETHVGVDVKDYRRFKPKNVRFAGGGIGKFKTKEKFDTITMIHVLEHLKDPVSVIGKLYSILKKGGKLIVMVPNRNGFMNMAKDTTCEEYSPHLWLLDREMLEFLLGKLGYDYEFMRLYLHVPFSGRLSRKSKFLYDFIVKIEYFLGRIVPMEIQPTLVFVINKR